MRKRVIGIILALALCLSLLPTGVLAAEAEFGTETDIVTETYIPDPDDLPDSDELFAGYVEKVFYGDINGGISLFSIPAREYLSESEKAAYDTLKTEIAKVAAGERSTTNFGVSITLNVGRALMADCPYELYWFDKEAGYSTNGSFYVAKDYAANGQSKTYTVNTTKTKATSTAVANAKAIVEKYRDVSDYEKLVGYKNEICALVDYNFDAIANDYDGGYGDPWQLINVFDGNPDTKVVCEGYSKAFQYLCDISGFDDVTCYCVSGTVTYGTSGSGGAHMWNIVRIGGENYLVDVTACDGGSDLFLLGGSGSVSAGYTVTSDSDATGTYKYNRSNSETAVYKDSDLSLASSNYVPTGVNCVTSVYVIDTGSNYPYYMGPSLSANVQTVGDVTYTYQWYEQSGDEFVAIDGATAEKYTTPLDLAVGEHPYYVVVSYGEGEARQVKSNIVPVRIVPRPMTDSYVQLSYTECAYTGYEQRPTVTASYGKTLVEDTDYTVTYQNNIEVGIATVTVTFQGNYTGVVTKTFTIKEVAPVQLTVSGVTAVDKTYDGTVTVKLNIADATLTASDGSEISGVQLDPNSATGTFDTANVGTNKTVTVTGLSLTGEKAGMYTLAQPTGLTADITAKSITVTIETISDQEYTGSEVKPAVTMTATGLVGNDTLAEGTDYTVTYSDNTNVGTAKVTVTAKEGSNYTFTEETASFNITKTIGAITVEGVTAPAKNGTPVNCATLTQEGINFSSITWYAGETGETALSGNFAASTVYRAEIEYTLDAGYQLAENVTVSAAGSTSAKIENNKIIIVYPVTAAKDALGGTVTISGTPVYGETLTAVTSGLDYGTEGAGTLSYQWNRDGVAIPGATESTYEVTEADIGKQITVTVTNSNNSGSVNSEATSAIAKAEYSGSAATPATVTATDSSTVTVTVTPGQEYAITTGNTEPTSGWQTTGVFTGLDPNTDYTVYTRVKETNTTKASASVTTSVTTDKLTQTITVTNRAPVVIFGGALDLNDICYSDAAGATLTYSAVDLPNGTSLSGSTITAGQTAGSFAVTVSSGEVGNYKAAEDVTITVTISEKEDAKVSLTGTANVTYGGTISVSASVTNMGANGSWTWTSSDSAVLTVSGDTAAPTVTILKVGSATITAAYESDTTKGNATLTVTVSPKTINITGVTATNRDYVAGNTSVTLSGGTLEGVKGEDNVGFELGQGKMEDADAGTNKRVNTNITLTGDDAGNYTLTQPTNVTVTINKINPTCAAPSGVAATFGQTLAEAVIGTAGTGDGTWAWENPTASVGSAGSNDFTMTFTPSDTTNYNKVLAKVSVTVYQAAGQTFTESASVRYSETAEKTVSIGNLMPGDAGTLTYTAGSKTDANSIIASWSVENGVVTYKLVSGLTAGNVGKTADLTVTIGSDNYQDSTVTITVTVVDKTEVTITGVTAQGGVYNGAGQKGYTGNPSSEYNGSYEITYTGTNYDPSAEAPINAGSYTVTIAVPASDVDYCGSITLNFTIEKAVVTFRAENKSAYVNSTMPELTYKVTGLVAEDKVTVEPTLECEADMTKTGSYTIAISGATVSNSENYIVDYVNGTLTVTNKSTSTKPAETEEEEKPCDGGRSCPSYGFSDLSASKWYHEAVDFVLENGLMSGFTDGTFQPNGALTRAMLAQILYNKEGRPAVRDNSTFSDVADTDWYADAVTWAAKNGLVTGYTSGKFGPEDPVTREQLAAILYRYAVYQGMTAVTLEENLLGFTDAGQISSFAVQPMNWAVGHGIISGKGSGILDPKGNATRAEVAQMLLNYVQEIEK